MQRGDRAEAVTIISPIHRWWSPWLRVTWPISDPVWLLKRDLVRLGFIHIAHWSLIARMPPRPRLRGKRLPHPFVIFQSNFNDDLNAYIDAFALVVPWRIRGVWQGVYHFPGPAPVDRFIGFILDRVIPTSYYYRAFPDASSTMIRAALRLERRHRRFKRHLGRPDPGTFKSRFQSFLADVEPQLQEAGARGAAPRRRSPSPRRGAARSLVAFVATLAAKPATVTIVAPVSENHEEQLARILTRMDTNEERPFERVKSTHFARFVLIPALLDGDGEPTGPPRSYMLFGADFDGFRWRRRAARKRWMDALADQIGAEIDEVLAHCEDCPTSRERDAFRRYLCRHDVGAGFSVISYSAAVARIRSTLALQSDLRDLANRVRGLTASELQAEWTRRFAG